MNGKVFVAGVVVGVSLTLVGARFVFQPSAVAGGAAALAPARGSVCPGDFDGNGVINTADLANFLAVFGTTCPADTDGDGLIDTADNCPLVFNPCQEDADGDGVGNLCDNCPTVPNPGQQDSNNDGVGDACCVSASNCPPRPQTSVACVADQCQYTCLPGFEDCDGNPLNGCETQLGTPANCAACGNACVFPNSTSTCVSGACSIIACSSGFSNCDGNINNGCETQHSGATNTCATATFLGTWCGDLNCGGFCNSSSPAPVANQTGTRGRWFRVRLSECDGCPGLLQHVVRLAVPSGINYDLHVYSSCGTLIGSSTNAAGVLDSFNVTRTRTGADDSFDYFIEVRYSSGASCSNWTMTVEARNCP